MSICNQSQPDFLYHLAARRTTITRTNLFKFAVGAKGFHFALRRLATIVRRYGFTAKKMNSILTQFVNLTNQHEAYPTFPITGIVVLRQPAIARYLHQSGVELAVHGWTHTSYSHMPVAQQITSVNRAQAAFNKANIPFFGFRSPYLSSAKEMPSVLKEANFKYVSNQSIVWPVIKETDYLPANWASYKLAHSFYNAWPAAEYASTPRIIDNLVEIPVSLPDDEMLIDRLGSNSQAIEAAWQTILEQTYCQEGMFILQLHPERINNCATALASVLSTAKRMTPSVWIAKLVDIADWWQARLDAKITARPTANNTWKLNVDGPPQLVWLARGVTTDAPVKATWNNGYRVIAASDINIHAPVCPFVGVSPNTPPALRLFLQQQGYLIEESTAPEKYGVYLNHLSFENRQERAVLSTIEQSGQPVVRLGRWPDGARSVLAITGDIDALTIWDYVLRLFGR